MGNICPGVFTSQGINTELLKQHAAEFLQEPHIRHAYDVVKTKHPHLVNTIKGWVPGGKPHKSDKRVDIDYDKTLPRRVDLRGPHMPPVYQQGSLGSCTANAIAGAFQYTQRKNGLNDFVPSRLFIYYNERQIEGTVNKDAGAVIRDGMKTIQDQGVCHETTWPYEVKNFDAKPPDQAYVEAELNQALKFAYVEGDNQLDAMRRVLHAGWPIIFGFQVPNSFEVPNGETATTGNLLLPTSTSDIKGGHAVLAVGYDDDRNALIVRNSWGDQWGDKGYFYMPYEYVNTLNRCSDFWVLNAVEDGVDPGAEDGGDRGGDRGSSRRRGRGGSRRRSRSASTSASGSASGSASDSSSGSDSDDYSS